jgi:hypothetical protein
MKRSRVTVLVALALLVTGFILGPHPLVDHFGETAQSGAGTFGSQWIHTDTSEWRVGLWGVSYSTTGRGVFGNATATSGDARGVFGQTASPNGTGVYGYNSASTGAAYGVIGHNGSTSGIGVYGNSTASTGATYGVLGVTDSSSNGTAGVFGVNRQNSGDIRAVQGVIESSNGIGVFGYVDPDTIGPNSPNGVLGINYPTTGTGIGVHGYNFADNGWAGRFDSGDRNGVKISSTAGSIGLVVSGGSKNAAVRTSDGDRLLYSEESTEVWFTDYGSAILRNGIATVTIDQTFAETVNLEEPYHVFLQAYGDVAIYVSKRTTTYFEVLAREGTSATDIEFAYRIVAKRKGFEMQRLEFAPWVSEETPYLVTPTPPAPLPPDPTPVPETNAQN